ncbi:MAG: hypothetical protein AB7O73_07285 [Bacteroidia bacterium]
MTIYGDGSQTRTFTYIDDNIDTIIKIFNDKLVVNDVINLGNDTLTTIKELAELIIKETNSSSKIINLPPLADGDMTRRQPDNKAMKTILSRPLIEIQDGIKRLLNSDAFKETIA